MITFTTIAPAVPMKIQDVDDVWLTVLAIHSYFDDAITENGDDTYSTFVTQYENFDTKSVLAQILTKNGWRDL